MGVCCSKKTIEERKMELEKYTVPIGTILWRTSPVLVKKWKPEDRRLCRETKKTGLYFANYIAHSIYLADELKKSMITGKYRTTKEIECFVNKFSYTLIRGKYHEEFLGTCCVSVRPLDENINHYSSTVHQDLNITEYNPDLGEIFIANPEDLDKLEFISAHVVHSIEVKEVFEKTRLTYCYGYCLSYEFRTIDLVYEDYMERKRINERDLDLPVETLLKKY